MNVDPQTPPHHPLTKDIKYVPGAQPANSVIYVKGIECAVTMAKAGKRTVYQVMWGNVKYTVTKGPKQLAPSLDDLRIIASKIQGEIDSKGPAEAAKLAAWNAGRAR